MFGWFRAERLALALGNVRGPADREQRPRGKFQRLLSDEAALSRLCRRHPSLPRPASLRYGNAQMVRPIMSARRALSAYGTAYYTEVKGVEAAQTIVTSSRPTFKHPPRSRIRLDANAIEGTSLPVAPTSQPGAQLNVGLVGHKCHLPIACKLVRKSEIEVTLPENKATLSRRRIGRTRLTRYSPQPSC